MKATLFRTLVLGIGLTAANTASAQFYYIKNVQINGLSNDGTVAVGNDPSLGGYRWTSSGGLVAFDDFHGIAAYGISGDGTTAVGFSPDGQAAYVTLPNTTHEVGVTQFYNHAKLLSSSRDGSVLGGVSADAQGNFGDAVVWTKASGLVDIGRLHLGDAYAAISGVSGNGQVLVGYSIGPNVPDAFTWTTSGGFQQLSDLKPGQGSGAFAVNSDGSIVIGNSGSISQPTIWRNGVPSALALLSGHGPLDGAALAMNADASLIGGYITGFGAIVWNSNGCYLLTDYLKQFGMTVPTGYVLREVTSISADGKTIAGWLTNSTRAEESGFVVTIPAPTPAMAFALLGVSAFASRRR